ncbi:MAG: ASCH domain-containing protein [Candidatus Baldrarchaeia archaeon]
MLFKRTLLGKILSGEKTQTRRPVTKKRGRQVYSVGQKVGVRNGFKPYVAYIIIKRRYKARLGDITEQDAKKEGFNSVEEFKQFWIEIYGKWDPNQLVWVYEFELANSDSTSKDTLSLQEAVQPKHQ